MTDVQLFFQPIFTLDQARTPQIVSMLFLTQSRLAEVARLAVGFALRARSLSTDSITADNLNSLLVDDRAALNMTELLQEYNFVLAERIQTDSDLAAFPMPPGATLQIGNGAAIAFDATTCDPLYLKSLNDRLALAAQAETPVPLPVPATTEPLSLLILTDYFQILITTAIKNAIDDLSPSTPDIPPSKSLANLLIDGAKLGGTVSRFLMHGTRLPDQTPAKALQPLYRLTAQQQPHQQADFKLSLPGTPTKSEMTIKASDSRFPAITDRIPAVPAQPATPAIPAVPATDTTPEIPEVPAKPAVEGKPEVPATPTFELASAGRTFDPTTNIRALTPFPPYAIIPKRFNFGKPLFWTDGGTGKLLYPLPQAFRRHLDDHPTIPANVSVAVGRDTNKKTIAWATRFDFTLRAALDPETGTPVANLFEIFCRDEDIVAAIHRVSAGGLTQASIKVVYGVSAAGALSDTSPAVRLIKANLSAQAAGSNTVVASALLSEPAAFLLLLAECATVQEGGFFLSYTAESTSTFSQLFAQTNEATATILVQGVSVTEVKPFHNCGIVDSTLVNPDAETLTVIPPTVQFTAGSTFDSVANSTDPFDRTNPSKVSLLLPNKSITVGGETRVTLPGDDLLGLSLAMAKGLKKVRDDKVAANLSPSSDLDVIRDAAIAAGAINPNADLQVHRDWVIRRTTLAPGNIGFRMMEPPVKKPVQRDADERTALARLQQLFSLLSFGLKGDTNFNPVEEGLPAAPSNGDPQDKNPPDGSPWIYQQVLSVASFSKPAPDAYAGVPATASLEFHFNDVFGNQLTDKPQLLEISVLYRDEVFSLSQWPSLSATFEFITANSAPALQIELSFDATRYDRRRDLTVPAAEVRDSAVPITRARDDLARYRAILAQISRSDVAISASSLGSVDAAFDLKAKFVKFATDAIAFLTPLELAQRPLIEATLKLGAAQRVKDTAATAAAEAKVKAAAAKAQFDDKKLASDTAAADAQAAAAQAATAAAEAAAATGLHVAPAIAVAQAAAAIAASKAAASQSAAAALGVAAAARQKAEDLLAKAEAALVKATADLAALEAVLAPLRAAAEAAFTTAGVPHEVFAPAITVSETLPVVFEVAASVTIKRTANIDPLFAGEDAVERSVSQLKPNYDVTGTVTTTANATTTTPTDPARTLDLFAEAFERAFAAQRLKLLAGPRMDQSQFLHAVPFRTSMLNYTPASAASFYALPPLATELFSNAAVPVQPYTTGQTLGTAHNQSFRGIDLDIWGRAFLHELDLFLSPKYAAQIDPLVYQKALQAKFDLAGAIVDDVTLIVDRPAGVLADLANSRLSDAKKALLTPAQRAAAAQAATNLAAAKETFRRRLLNRIGDAYSIDTIVQLPVRVTYPAAQPSARITIRPIASSTTTTSFTMADDELSLKDGAGTLNFLFDSTVEPRFRKIGLNTLALQPRELAFGASDPDHYVFIRPPAPDSFADAVTVPVPLRAYPVPPSLRTQAANPFEFGDNPSFEDLKKYTYFFTYSFSQTAQDEIVDHSLFGGDVDVPVSTVPPNGELSLKLAQYASISAALITDFSDPDGDKRNNAFSIFADQAATVAAAWKLWDPPFTAAPNRDPAALNEPFEDGFRHTAPPKDIIRDQTALGGLHVTRNRNLLENIETNPTFVYTLPNQTFPAPLVPLVTYNKAFDIGSLNPAATTVRTHLTAMFEKLLEVDTTRPADKGRFVRIAISYEFALAGSGDNVIETIVPVLLKPKFKFNPTTDFGDSGVCATLDKALGVWQTANVPPGNGTWIFDVSVYYTGDVPGANRPPLLELTNLRLRA